MLSPERVISTPKGSWEDAEFRSPDFHRLHGGAAAVTPLCYSHADDEKRYDNNIKRDNDRNPRQIEIEIIARLMEEHGCMEPGRGSVFCRRVRS
jgi:hypothetical protein